MNLLIPPSDTTVRSLECWSIQNFESGSKLGDSYAARAAVFAGCRYGLNRYGRLVFVFIVCARPDGTLENGQTEYDLQRKPTTRDTMVGVRAATVRAAMQQERK